MKDKGRGNQKARKVSRQRGEQVRQAREDKQKGRQARGEGSDPFNG